MAAYKSYLVATRMSAVFLTTTSAMARAVWAVITLHTIVLPAVWRGRLAERRGPAAI